MLLSCHIFTHRCGSLVTGAVLCSRCATVAIVRALLTSQQPETHCFVMEATHTRIYSKAAPGSATWGRACQPSCGIMP